MKKRVIAAAIMFTSINVLADECDNPQTQAEMNTCASAQFKSADKKLNETYSNAMQRAPEQTRPLLKAAQQKWIELRDADCALVASGTDGGSIQPMIRSQCLADKTVERTAWLESMLNCEEGDLSCPLPPGN